jgi:phytoene dehydrogenase-like protein
MVEGGGARLVQGLTSLIEEAGGVVQLRSDVERVIVRAGRATGVRTVDGREFAATRAVVCNVTPTQLYSRLLTPRDILPADARCAQDFRYGRAEMQIHLALRSPPRWPCERLSEVAMLHVTSGPDGVSKAVNEADRGLLPTHPTIVVAQPVAVDPSRAPTGKSILWIQLQEVPSQVRGDAAGQIPCEPSGRWTPELRERYADRVIDLLAAHITELKPAILARRVLSPADLESLNMNLVGGDPYGGACTLDQLLWWRPSTAAGNHRTSIRRLFHIGASTHPGPGLGGMSGFLVAKAIA